mmetsp:Transcript_21220/g.38731  ORF Transcript_21220/g.38731 Transcript_21220/m.38731 type:complete len:348 (+) Transcript_21220:88-1131(+)
MMQALVCLCSFLALLQAEALVDRTSARKAIPEERLARIESVPEYRALVRDDKARNDWKRPLAGESVVHGPLQVKNENEPSINIGYFPHFTDPKCWSGGAPFCDPQQALNRSAQGRVGDMLKHFAEKTVVTCGHLESRLAGSDKYFHRYFHLGVAVINDWPESETDPMSLEHFGQVLLAQWGLSTTYNGENLGEGVQSHLPDSAVYDHCPNSAMLIVLPKYGISYISSPTCEFFCANRGGRLVTAKVEQALRYEGVEAALMAGIAEVRRLLDVTTPLSLQEHWPFERALPLDIRLALNEDCWKVSMRIFAFIMVGLAISMAIVFIYNIFYPPKEVPSRTLIRLGSSNY